MDGIGQDDSFHVSFREFDREHEGLIEMLNHFTEMNAGAIDSTVISARLNAMKDRLWKK